MWLTDGPGGGQMLMGHACLLGALEATSKVAAGILAGDQVPPLSPLSPLHFSTRADGGLDEGRPGAALIPRAALSGAGGGQVVGGALCRVVDGGGQRRDPRGRLHSQGAPPQGLNRPDPARPGPARAPYPMGPVRAARPRAPAVSLTLAPALPPPLPLHGNPTIPPRPSTARHYVPTRPPPPLRALPTLRSASWM